MIYKTNELTGPLLDAAVAKVLYGDKADATLDLLSSGLAADGFLPSSNWAHGGPIIERESIMVCRDSRRNTDWWANVDGYMSHDYVSGEFSGVGPTPLVAAMRALVSAKMGEEVNL